MNTYDLTLERDDEQLEVKLRLTVGGQLNLKKRFKENALATILDAGEDVEKCVAVLQEALRFKGNENKIQNGEELYDILVENGYKDYEGFGEVMLGIGVASGICSEEKKKKVLDNVKGIYDDAIDGVFGDDGKNV